MIIYVLYSEMKKTIFINHSVILFESQKYFNNFLYNFFGSICGGPPKP